MNPPKYKIVLGERMENVQHVLKMQLVALLLKYKKQYFFLGGGGPAILLSCLWDTRLLKVRGSSL